MKYRIAVKKDIDFLVQSRLSFLEIAPVHPGYAFMEKSCRHYFQESLENDSLEVLLAEEGTRTVGIGMLFYYRSVPSRLNPTGQNGYLTNLFVEEGFRRQGIGRQIAQSLIDRAGKRNCYIIMLHASEMGRPLYLEMGFQEIANGMILNNWATTRT